MAQQQNGASALVSCSQSPTIALGVNPCSSKCDRLQMITNTRQSSRLNPEVPHFQPSINADSNAYAQAETESVSSDDWPDVRSLSIVQSLFDGEEEEEAADLDTSPFEPAPVFDRQDWSHIPSVSGSEDRWEDPYALPNSLPSPITQACQLNYRNKSDGHNDKSTCSTPGYHPQYYINPRTLEFTDVWGCHLGDFNTWGQLLLARSGKEYFDNVYGSSIRPEASAQWGYCAWKGPDLKSLKNYMVGVERPRRESEPNLRAARSGFGGIRCRSTPPKFKFASHTGAVSMNPNECGTAGDRPIPPYEISRDFHVNSNLPSLAKARDRIYPTLKRLVDDSQPDYSMAFGHPASP